ncbi:MAG: GTPase ObgE [Candidatus Eremiobacteraeota bacterium]|nr:GTPase ObgE [Candidatus Eremiobacteraeota bacterium]MBC5826356.1 GTPase ObgE [Candidatus Eremiobacteraeota bacterium]
MFVDEAKLTVRAGDGGNGLVAFRREKYVPRGGPSGGDGGKGGSIIFVADPQLSTLADFAHKRLFAAPAGDDGGPNNRHGKDGGDIVVRVPCGTLVSSNGEQLADLGVAGAQIEVAKGGRGGLGNQHYATPIDQAPRYAQRGEPGEERVLDLSLKLLADAGIVGAPNAGKSTLLSAVSSARPKIADYPFTTLTPQLGVVRIDIEASFVLVDVPGLIEGASKGTGLGDRFLRHVERAGVLVHLVDGALSPQSALEQFGMIEGELAQWDGALLEKRRIVAVSKLDLPQGAQTLRALEQHVGHPVHGISAATGAGVKRLVAATYAAVGEARLQRGASSARAPILSPRPTSVTAGVSIVREGGAFRLSGQKLERLAVMTDLRSSEGRDYFERVLARSGALRKLRKLGARPGDILRVGSAEIVFS